MTGRTNCVSAKGDSFFSNFLKYIYLPTSGNQDYWNWVVEKDKYYTVVFTNTVAETSQNPLILTVTNAEIIYTSAQVRSANNAGEYAKKWVIKTHGTSVKTTISPHSYNSYARFIIM